MRIIKETGQRLDEAIHNDLKKASPTSGFRRTAKEGYVYNWNMRLEGYGIGLALAQVTRVNPPRIADEENNTPLFRLYQTSI